MDGSPSTEPTTTRLTVLYDESCPLCRRSRDWLLGQPCFVGVELLPAGSLVARSTYGSIPWLGKELVAVDQSGRVWVGPAAFLTCLWATVRFRPWSYRLAGATLAPFAERFFMLVSKRRDRVSAWIVRRQDPECSWCDEIGMFSPDRTD